MPEKGEDFRIFFYQLLLQNFEKVVSGVPIRAVTAG
jgi:hypothetical protein